MELPFTVAPAYPEFRLLFATLVIHYWKKHAGFISGAGILAKIGVMYYARLSRILCEGCPVPGSILRHHDHTFFHPQRQQYEPQPNAGKVA
jgi:hypothetical protein